MPANKTLKKIISGGQTGGDMAGLIAAKLMGLKTGGTAPNKFITANGPKPDLLNMMYGLREGVVDPKTFPMRTMANVDNANATVAQLVKPSPGTGNTIGYAESGRWQKASNETPGVRGGYRPHAVVGADKAEAIKLIRQLLEQNPEILNVAGHREGSVPGIEQRLKQWLMEAVSGQAPVDTRTYRGKALSNMMQLSKPIKDALGIEYPTVEHAYKAAGTSDPEIRKRISELRGTGDPGWAGLPAKRFQVDRPESWHQNKLALMEKLLRVKFKNPKEQQTLLETGQAPIIELDPKGTDKYWAQDPTGSGENFLGRILERIRAEHQGVSYGPKTFKLVGTGTQAFTSVMRSGDNNMSNTAPMKPGWLGNPYKWEGNGGPKGVSVQEVVDKFKSDFLKKIETDPAFKEAVLNLKGKTVQYYKPDEAGPTHAKVIRDWLAEN